MPLSSSEASGARGFEGALGLRILNGLPHLGHLARLPSAEVGTLSFAPQSQRTVILVDGAVAIAVVSGLSQFTHGDSNDRVFGLQFETKKGFGEHRRGCGGSQAGMRRMALQVGQAKDAPPELEGTRMGLPHWVQ